MRTRERSASGRALVGNDILRALLNSQYKRLRPKLESVDLKRGEVIYQADKSIEYVYFPGSAAVAMVDTLEDGGTVEVGFIGHEGMVGINIFLGCLTTPDKAVVQISGDAMRMKTNDLRQELRFGSPLQRLLLRYTQALLAVISQLVACSQHHTVEQRLARWLLTMRSHAQSNEFEMSHASIAALLGARREAVSQAASQLKASGLIAYTRTRICVLSEAGLRKRSCECYRFIQQQFEGLLSDVPKVLSDKSRRTRRGSD